MTGLTGYFFTKIKNKINFNLVKVVKTPIYTNKNKNNFFLYEGY